MRAGRLRHRVTIQSPAGSRDAVGQRQTTWSDVVTSYPAAIDPLRVHEQFAASQAQSSTTHKITVRYSQDIAAMDGSWRVLFGERVFTIDGVRNIEERNRMMEILATEGLRDE